MDATRNTVFVGRGRRVVNLKKVRFNLNEESENDLPKRPLGRAAKLHKLNKLRIPKCFVLNDKNDNEEKPNIKKPVEGQFEDVTIYKDKLLNAKGDDCICHRDRVELRCHKCTNLFKGRPSIACKLHSNIIHLMDMTHCPSCRTEL